MKKLARYALILVFFIANMSVTVKAETGGTNIISSSRASLQQMQQWAKNNNATDTFVSLAEIYWNEVGKHGNIDPVVAYAQSAKETAFGRFGGVLDESFHNPCGLKSTAGGDNSDPNAHQRFNSWQDGIDAHLDHLALYAGANGYPRSETLDPRHKAYLLGTAKTVEDLGGKWAGSATYGTEVASYMQQIQSTTIPVVLPNRSNIDAPSNNESYVNKSVNLSGWVLSGDGIKQIKVLVNNSYVGDANINISRPDVRQAYPQYNQDSSGYQLTIDKSKLTDGDNKIEIQAETYKGNKIVESRTIKVDTLQPRMNLDIDTSLNYPNNSDLAIRGWALINSGVKSVDVILNGQSIGAAQYGYSRPDVSKVYPNYNNLNSEFRFTLSKDKLKLGQNNITVNVNGQNGETISQSRIINTKKYDVYGNLDAPGSTETSNDVNIRGWAINGSGMSSANIYIDGKYIADASIENRDDIPKAFPNYPNNNSSGYNYTISKSLISHGKHQLSIKVNFKNGDSYKVQKDFVYQVIAPKIQIDQPTFNNIENSQAINISGWSLNYSGVSSVDVIVNNKTVGKAQIGISRSDVYNAYPQYKDQNSGFSYTVGKNYLVEGSNCIQLNITGNDGVVTSAKKYITFSPLGFSGSLDGPKEKVMDSDAVIYGWALDGYGIKDAKVYVDNNFVSNANLGIARQDVAKAYPNYTNSDKAGFSYTLPKGSLSYGYHVVTVNVTTNANKLYTFTKKVYYYKYDNLINIDSPNEGGKYRLADKLNVSGWSLNYTGINEVRVSIDGNYISSASYGSGRQDVYNVYPQYGNNKSGFSQDIDISKLARGYHTIEVKAIGKDGAEVSQSKSFYANDFNSLVNIDEPTYAYLGSNVKVRGWALSYLGVKDVKVKLNDMEIGSALYGISRSDVAQAYPYYSNASNSGFELTIDSSKLKAGTNNLQLTISNYDGTSVVAYRNFNVDSIAVGNLDSPTNGQLVKTGSKVSGWALFAEGTKEANVYVDGVMRGKALVNIARADVQKAYSQYSNSYNAGFEYTLDLSTVKGGSHKVRVEVISNLNRTINIEQNFSTNAKLIVIDPGHNYAGDSGSERTIDKVNYSETELNMQVAVKLQAKLMSMGYSVIMTRQPWERPMDNLDTSLQKRTKLADDVNADLFVSIHHDVSDKSQETNGVSTHYSTYRPSLDNDGIVSGTDPGGWSYDDLKIDTTPTVQAQLSRQLANNVVNALGSRLAYNNLKAHDHGLYVTRNINTPSILIECGFISNPQEAIRCANQDEQQNKANVIADEIGKMF